ncbi:hypothetical protein NBRC10512_004152 [Rhodotorula toruloides]|uniref:RHTO0S27e01486g1_1 n=2 Tax=Rhodotorula toruloides TaxID=5286 RepID=A0A061BNG2_RHOTO|nr:mitochondrial protein [Rhodotorula toruloides NP11]EMS22640.1 mitochondrial protein [Rhodotorula toruloides NP11]CDR49524.1 RHTO0S27e01486g1_1 [Rhodotorula toruloides]
MASIKLSPALKALIAAPHAHGGPVAARSAADIQSTLHRLANSARENGVGKKAWLTLGSAALVTLNSPETLCALYRFVTKDASGDSRAETAAEYAAVMREAGLKTISFSGIPRAINNLGALRECLEPEVASLLSSQPTRQPTPTNLPDILSSANSLWNSIYAPHSTKLLHKLSQSHPDLPVHILSSHYGPLLADPFGPPPSGHAKVGRILTSVVAIACLRAQGGVGPQVTSHVFGLRKAGEKGSGAELEEKVEGGEWLTTEDGAKWVIEQVDALVQLVQGPTFARAKL